MADARSAADRGRVEPLQQDRASESGSTSGEPEPGDTAGQGERPGGALSQAAPQSEVEQIREELERVRGLAQTYVQKYMQAAQALQGYQALAARLTDEHARMSAYAGQLQEQLGIAQTDVMTLQHALYAARQHVGGGGGSGGAGQLQMPLSLQQVTQQQQQQQQQFSRAEAALMRQHQQVVAQQQHAAAQAAAAAAAMQQAGLAGSLSPEQQAAGSSGGQRAARSPSYAAALSGGGLPGPVVTTPSAASEPQAFAPGAQAYPAVLYPGGGLSQEQLAGGGNGGGGGAWPAAPSYQPALPTPPHLQQQLQHPRLQTASPTAMPQRAVQYPGASMPPPPAMQPQQRGGGIAAPPAGPGRESPRGSWALAAAAARPAEQPAGMGSGAQRQQQGADASRPAAAGTGTTSSLRAGAAVYTPPPLRDPRAAAHGTAAGASGSSTADRQQLQQHAEAGAPRATAAGTGLPAGVKRGPYSDVFGGRPAGGGGGGGAASGAQPGGNGKSIQAQEQ